MAAKEKICSELTEDDDEQYIAMVISRALGLPIGKGGHEACDPADCIARASQHDWVKDNEMVDMLEEMPLKYALLAIAGIISEMKAAKAAKEKAKRDAKEKEKQAKIEEMAKKKREREEAAAVKAKKDAEEKEKRDAERFANANDFKFGETQTEFGCVNTVIGDLVEKPKLTKEEMKKAKKAAAEAKRKARQEKKEEEGHVAKTNFRTKAKKEMSDEEKKEIARKKFEEESGIDSAGHRAVVVTGVLTSSENSRDIQFDNFSLTFQGSVLVRDTSLHLNYNRRYGLLGLNGSGKSTLLCAIGQVRMFGVATVPHHARSW
eukprot:COSAG05_NODE_2920_length_2509_cov_85.126141_6_plen_319_part_00